jgi:transposase
VIPRKAGERVKTDRRDSLMLARLHRAGELTAVRVPDDAQEGLRDLTRAREDMRHLQRQAKQRLCAFLLRYGKCYSGKSNWTQAHYRWLEEQQFGQSVQQIVFRECRAQAQQIGEVRDVIGSLEQNTQQNVTLVQQSATAAQTLKEQAQGLLNAAQVFTLPLQIR